MGNGAHKTQRDIAQNRADNNREMRIIAHRLLDKLLAEACEPAFFGSLTIEINSADGYIAPMKSIRTRHRDPG